MENIKFVIPFRLHPKIFTPPSIRGDTHSLQRKTSPIPTPNTYYAKPTCYAWFMKNHAIAVVFCLQYDGRISYNLPKVY